MVICVTLILAANAMTSLHIFGHVMVRFSPDWTYIGFSFIRLTVNLFRHLILIEHGLYRDPTMMTLLSFSTTHKVEYQYINSLHAGSFAGLKSLSGIPSSGKFFGNELNLVNSFFFSYVGIG